MKTAGEILQELGFNKHASDSAKEAFVRHLLKASQQKVAVSEKKTAAQKKQNSIQMCFDFQKAI